MRRVAAGTLGHRASTATSPIKIAVGPPTPSPASAAKGRRVWAYDRTAEASATIASATAAVHAPDNAAASAGLPGDRPTPDGCPDQIETSHEYGDTVTARIGTTTLGTSAAPATFAGMNASNRRLEAAGIRVVERIDEIPEAVKEKLGALA